MKKYIILATAALALAACSNEEENVQAWNGEISLSAVSVSQSTRAAGQAVQSTLFDEGGSIDVFINENTTGTPSTTYEQPLVYYTGSMGSLIASSTQYYPSSGNGINVFAVYPNNVAGTDVNATAVTFNVRADQSTVVNYKGSDLMVGAPASNPVARTATTIPLIFKHCMTKINLNILPSDGLSISALDNAYVRIEGITNGATFNVKTGAVSAVERSDSAYISLGNMSVNNPDDKSIAVSAIMVPQTVAAGTPFIKITLNPTGATSTTLTYTLPSGASITFDPSKVYTFNITARNSGLNIDSSTITPWTDGGTFTGDAIPGN